MGAAFLITLREGLEMALVVALILAYVRRTGTQRDARVVWAGTGAGAAVALVAGAIVFAAVGELAGRAEELVEGVIALVAAGVLTWMVLWMRAQAKTIGTSLRAKVDQARMTGSAVALAAVAFAAILREGLETALFLLGSSVGNESSASQAAGGIAGLACAAAVGYLIYRGSDRVDLRAFFSATGILVLLFAAGLLAKSVHEFQEAGVIGTMLAHVWDVSSVSFLNPKTSTVADFLKGLFGWSPNPSIEMISVWLAYTVSVAPAFLSGTRRIAPRPAADVPVAQAR